MELIYLNRFDSQFDIVVKPLPTAWTTFASLITGGHTLINTKTSGVLFNAVRYKTLEEIQVAGSAVGITDEGQRYVKRRKSNIATVDLLVLDYDGTITIQQAQERFRQYEHVGYTSFSHMADGQSHKFRLVIRLNKPIPAHFPDGASDPFTTQRSDWYRLREGLHSLAGPCDPASFNANQIYYLPSVHPDQSNHADSWHNPGESLNWEELLAEAVSGVSKPSKGNRWSSGRKRSRLVLTPSDVLRTQAGDIRVADIRGTVQGVWCPFHDDRNGTEFVRRLEEPERVFLYCRKCDQSFYMVEEKSEADQTFAHTYEEISALKQQVLDDPKLSNKERDYRLKDIQQLLVQSIIPEAEIWNKFTNALDRSRVEGQLDEIKDSILKPESYFDRVRGHITAQPRAHIVYMPEGAGKSRLAVEIAKEGRKVVFACKSWAQAIEKFEGFREAGKACDLTVRLLRSKEAKIRNRFKVEAVRSRPSNPFESGRIDDEASIQRIIEHHPEIPRGLVRLTWQFLGQDCLYDDVIRMLNQAEACAEEHGDIERPIASMLDQTSTSGAIIVTTFAQLRTLHSRMQFIPKDWIVWFDDPDISDVVDIAQFDRQQFGHWTDEEIDTRTFKINGRRYHGRPARESLGRPYSDHLCVYTTTERITLRAIQKLVSKHGQRTRLHDRMEGIAGGKITVLGTEKVYAKQDAVIPLLIRRLNKQKHAVQLIANGLSQGLNHSSSKGKNDLADKNLIVEVSAPHPAHVQTICDALDLSFESESREITRDMMIDQMHQAIGRNSGYRFRDGESVVLVDPNQHQWLLTNTRYLVDRENSKLIDRTATMSRRDRRTTDTASTLVQNIEFFLNNLGEYFEDGRKVLPDINAVMSEIEHPEKRTAYAKRLIHAIYSLSGCHPGNGPGDPNDRRETAYRRALERLQTQCQGSEWDKALAGFMKDIASLRCSLKN